MISFGVEVVKDDTVGDLFDKDAPAYVAEVEVASTKLQVVVVVEGFDAFKVVVVVDSAVEVVLRGVVVEVVVDVVLRGVVEVVKTGGSATTLHSVDKYSVTFCTCA
jgi:hypothetical protein